MKWILILLVGLSFSVQAKNGKRFEERKAKALEHIGKRISVLETTKSCISSASDKAALKACRATQKASMQALKSERKAWRANRKKNRKNKNK